MSKTDPDATFMRMKDDHMRNGQLKAGYNLQISTNDQYILNYDLYQNPTDALTLPSHLAGFKDLYGAYPDVVVADAGYGSEENYEYLEQAQIESYVKYSYFHQEQKSKGKIKLKDAFRAENLYYNEQHDYYVCPMGQRMENVGQSKEVKKSGFVQLSTIYQAQRCDRCPLRGACHKVKANRKISINFNLLRHKQKTRSKLLSDEGLKHRSKRPADVEAVFGNIKQNKKVTPVQLQEPLSSDYARHPLSQVIF